MAEYRLVINQHVRYTVDIDADSPQDALNQIQTGSWDDTNNEVLSDRVRVYDETEEQLLLDTAQEELRRLDEVTALTGHVSEKIAVTLEIDNVYEDGESIQTFVETEIDPPPTDAELENDEDGKLRDDWEQENIFEHTGTGKTEGDAGYFVKVLQSSDPERLPPGTMYEFC